MTAFAFRMGADARTPYVVLLHTAQAPEADIWDDYVRALIPVLAKAERAVHVFAVTDGGGPDSSQRSSLAKAFEPDRLGSTTHVFTTSPLTRGIVTAFHWIARSRATAHLPSEFAGVCERSGVPGQAVLDDLFDLQKLLPPVALLARIARSCGVNVPKD